MSPQQIALMRRRRESREKRGSEWMNKPCTSIYADKGDKKSEDCQEWCDESKIGHCRYCKCRGCKHCHGDLTLPDWVRARDDWGRTPHPKNAHRARAPIERVAAWRWRLVGRSRRLARLPRAGAGGATVRLDGSPAVQDVWAVQRVDRQRAALPLRLARCGAMPAQPRARPAAPGLVCGTHPLPSFDGAALQASCTRARPSCGRDAATTSRRTSGGSRGLSKTQANVHPPTASTRATCCS
eukprot:742861-Prymnesium_polylepis.2